jgi:uncharacterized protein
VPATLTTSAGEVLATDVRWATSTAARTKGLLGRRSFPPDLGALIFPRTKQVHTFGMRFEIDVVFCSVEWEVLHVINRMKPGRISRIILRARYAVELPAGAAENITKGVRLALD